MAEANKKMQEITKPIVYGNVAYPLAKRNPKGHTHLWTVYVKPFQNEEMSYVHKVQFKLHRSFSPPVRVITKPPFEVTETGWGEFEINIKIFFKDSSLHYVTLRHDLLLYAVPGVKYEEGMDTRQETVSEFYDELVFHNPSQFTLSFFEDLKPVTDGPYTHHVDFEAKKKEAEENLAKAQRAVKEEMKVLMEKIGMTRALTTKYNLKMKLAQRIKAEEDDRLKLDCKEIKEQVHDCKKKSKPRKPKQTKNKK